MSKRTRVPGQRASKDYRIPKCSINSEHRVRRNDKQEWFCVECADQWLGEYIHGKVGNVTPGGVALPAGVESHRKASFIDVLPNRAARRRKRRG